MQINILEMYQEDIDSIWEAICKMVDKEKKCQKKTLS